MSTAGGSEAKYDVILEKLAELKALVEKTDKTMGVLLNTEEQERMEEAARRKAEVDAVRRKLTEMEEMQKTDSEALGRQQRGW
jgi:hypothetical protein